jgi:enoyl-CoA hydratase/carnithine racemase
MRKYINGFKMTGRAGNITINVPQALNADNGQITASQLAALAKAKELVCPTSRD